jgi:hypothetical protein
MRRRLDGMRLASVVVLALATGLLARPVLAQTPAQTPAQSTDIVPENWTGAGGAYFDLASPTAVTIHVHVWGDLGRPGIYKLPRGTRLSTLYSSAGGPTAGPQAPRQRRDTTIKLLRPNGSDFDVVFERNFRNQPTPFADDIILQNGDVLSVESRTRATFHWREVLTTASSIGTFILLYYRLSGQRR